MRNSIILGLGFGDEGKGLTTSFLASQSAAPLVIRFNGGHQAGHTVVYKGMRHVFSTFGAGTLQGAATFISRFCTFYPIAAWNEFTELTQKGISPELYIAPLAMVTTPYDYLANQVCDSHKNNGTVGVGFGYTVKRHEAYYKLHLQDLLFETVLRAKMENIRDYYERILGFQFDKQVLEEKLSFWYGCIAGLKKKGLINTHLPKKNKAGQPFDHHIFEGAQGILLDMDYGFFPNVTRSHTTSKNALSLLSCSGPRFPDDIYYVTRAYQTRHGAGFLPHENNIKLINNENETNKSDSFQGNFRTAPLDLDLINYAIQCDANNDSGPCKKNIVVTCLDQMPDPENIVYYANNERRKGGICDILAEIGTKFDKKFISKGAGLDDMIELQICNQKTRNPLNYKS